MTAAFTQMSNVTDYSQQAVLTLNVSSYNMATCHRQKCSNIFFKVCLLSESSNP